MAFHRAQRNLGPDDETEVREQAVRKLVEERIQSAMEKGAFDNLPGKGRPLQLDFNPYVRPELRLAYKVLADANFAPDWIELDKRVRAAREEIDSIQRQHIAWLERHVQSSRRQPTSLRTRHERTRRELEKRLNELNRKIDELNLIVPLLSLQRPRISVEDVLVSFDDECRRASGNRDIVAHRAIGRLADNVEPE